MTSVLDELIQQYLREEHSERQKIHLEETRELSESVSSLSPSLSLLPLAASISCLYLFSLSISSFSLSLTVSLSPAQV